MAEGIWNASTGQHRVGSRDGVLKMAEDLHQINIRASAMPGSLLADKLEFILKTWHESKCDFDKMVYDLITCVLQEYRQMKGAGKIK